MTQKKDFSKECYEKITQLANDLNRAHLLDYIELVSNPKRLFWLNFLSGIAKGLGLTIGTAIILLILFKMTQHVISLNIPYITEWVTKWISEITNIIRSVK